MPNLLVCPLPDGGICHYTFSLADAMHQLGCPATVFTSRSGYELQGLKHAHRVRPELNKVGRRLSRAPDFLSNLGRLLQEGRDARITHVQWPLGREFDLPLWRALKLAGKRIVYTAHNVKPHESGNSQEAHTVQLYRLADAVIVHGENLKQELLSLADIEPDRVHVVSLGNYNFIADRFTKWTRETARQSFGFEAQDRVVLFFGFIRPYKGLDTLISACGVAARNDPSLMRSLRLLIAGSNSLSLWSQEGYEEQIVRAGIKEITLPVLEYVPLEDVARFFLAADLVAMPYKTASQSAVLPLAYAFAKPSIVTDVGSLREVAAVSGGAVLIPPNDPEALAEALQHLVSSEQRMAEMGRAGRDYASDVLDWRKIAGRTLDLYRRISN